MKKKVDQNQENRATEPEIHHFSRSRPSTQPILPPSDPSLQSQQPLSHPRPSPTHPQFIWIPTSQLNWTLEMAVLRENLSHKKWEKGPSSTWPEGTIRGLAPSNCKLITRIFKILRVWGIFSLYWRSTAWYLHYPRSFSSAKAGGWLEPSIAYPSHRARKQWLCEL